MMYLDLDMPIKVTSFGRIEQSRGFWHGDWTRSAYMMIYLADGDLVVKAGDKHYRLSAGDTLIIPPKTPYRPLESGGCVYYYFDFQANECEPYESKYAIKASHCRGIPNFSYAFSFAKRSVIEVQDLTRHSEDSRLGKIFNRCAELDLWQRPHEKVLLDNYLKEVLIQLSFAQKTPSTVDQAFTRMTAFIQSNYKKNIGLREVAEKVHLSPSYAAKLFKKNANMRCCDYINQVRLSAACEILVNTSMRISDIAEEVGYTSQYYFARQFKKTYSMTAMQFRKKGVE